MGLRSKTDTNKKLTPTLANKVTESSYQAPKHYHDGDVELDAIERLKSNIMMLDDLQERLRFMNNEIESIIGSKKKS